MPKLYYKYWQKQELLNPYSKHSKFYTSSNLNTYKRQSPSHLSLKNLSNLSESLIKSACLKNRASLDMESVGGEVKTVIISKHEGFRWKNDKK